MCIRDSDIAVPGTLIGFDDWGGTPKWQELKDGNPKAFVEIIKKYNLSVDHIVQYGQAYPHVANVFSIKSVGEKS